jgi:hypothetical protein
MIVDTEMTSDALNELSTQIGEWSESKGFRQDWKDADTLEWLAEVLENSPYFKDEQSGDFVYKELRRIAAAHRTLVISSKIALAHSELSEMHEALRDTGAKDIHNSNFGEELADTIIRLLDLAHMTKGAPGDETVQKVEHNNGRPYLHDRKF